MIEGRPIRCCGSATCGRIEGVERWCVWSECAAWRETKAGVRATTDENNNPIAGVAAEGWCGLAGPVHPVDFGTHGRATAIKGRAE